MAGEQWSGMTFETELLVLTGVLRTGHEWLPLAAHVQRLCVFWLWLSFVLPDGFCFLLRQHKCLVEICVRANGSPIQEVF